MTVISTVITQFCTAHASDSMVTRGKNEKDYHILDLKSTKIVCVRRWSGAMTYFGLAVCDDLKTGNRLWSTLEWLRSQANNATQFNAPEEFARDLATKLDHKINSLPITDEKEKGIGIHFTAYEDVDGIPIPEFFHITNFANVEYKQLLPEGVRVTRETYNNLTNDGDSPRSRHGEPEYRREVRKRLSSGGMLIFNNGDTDMFNIASDAIRGIMNEAKKRNILQPRNDPKAHRELAMWPIELVAKVQKNFIKSGYQKVGGDLHNLSITPIGEYASETGDDRC